MLTRQNAGSRSDKEDPMGAPASAQLIQFRPKGRPSKADELRLEFAARMTEEQRMAESIAPLVRRLRLMADGPVALATVTAIDAALTRHARRWTADGGDAA
jgi:hypothetical protein